MVCAIHPAGYARQAWGSVFMTFYAIDRWSCARYDMLLIDSMLGPLSEGLN